MLHLFFIFAVHYMRELFVDFTENSVLYIHCSDTIVWRRNRIRDNINLLLIFPGALEVEHGVEYLVFRFTALRNSGSIRQFFFIPGES